MQGNQNQDDIGWYLRLSDFATNTHLIRRQVARTQMLLDKKFKEQLLDLQRNMYAHKITLAKFWEQYKKMILKSVGQNNKKVKGIIKNLDKDMKHKIKEAQTEYEKQKPIDLSLPK